MRRLVIQLGRKVTEFLGPALLLVFPRGLPFVVRVPNAETIAALNEPTHNLQQFESEEDLFADIEAGTSGSRAPGDDSCANP